MIGGVYLDEYWDGEYQKLVRYAELLMVNGCAFYICIARGTMIIIKKVFS